jgi:HD superfamily phosphohydrolase
MIPSQGSIEMAGKLHEIRDPIHVFIRLDSAERKLVDSRPFQRLRHIHQLALTHLVYPGATHRRFEHSLGVMETASRIYDVVTDSANIRHISVQRILGDREYWRRVLRAAALCHDLGHLPFSHAAEKELLPEGWSHERLGKEIILGELAGVLRDDLQVQPEDVAKLAVGPEYFNEEFSDWEAILCEMITGDAFGADRIDYLLRDSHHAGVAYGRFDHHRLIDTLRLLPTDEASEEPVLGVQEGGLQSAEALLWARYLMYTQLYFHPVRRVYDIHLRDFLQEWLPQGRFSTGLNDHLRMTDNEVMAAISEAAQDQQRRGYEHARRIVCRQHFKLLYQRNPLDQARNAESVRFVYEAAVKRYGEAQVRRDTYREPGGAIQFPVLGRDGRIQSSLAMSETLAKIPTFAVDYVYVDPTLREDAEKWLRDHRDSIIP